MHISFTSSFSDRVVNYVSTLRMYKQSNRRAHFIIPLTPTKVGPINLTRDYINYNRPIKHKFSSNDQDEVNTTAKLAGLRFAPEKTHRPIL